MSLCGLLDTDQAGHFGKGTTEAKAQSCGISWYTQGSATTLWPERWGSLEEEG